MLPDDDDDDEDVMADLIRAHMDIWSACTLTLCPTFCLVMLQKGGGEGVSHNAMLPVPWA